MEFWQDHFLRDSLHRLFEDWPLKGIATGLLAEGLFHVELASLFTAVVMIDLLTKWLALAHGYLEFRGEKKRDILSCLFAIPAAHRAGIISSREMKYGFCGKLAVYILLTLGSALADHMLVAAGRQPVFAGLCIAYLAASEMVSIAENLNDAGVSALAELVKQMKGKK